MPELDYFAVDLLKVLVSLAMGGLVGLEREVSDKAAGLRTNILICVGATLFTLLSSYFSNDPARISAQLVSGIGFIGAGAIMREGDRVTGLTTAATIWTVAAIGMAVGYGHYSLAALVTATVLFVQLAFTQLDILIDDWRERHTYRIVSKLDDKSLDEIEKLFREARVRVIRSKVMKRQNIYYSEWYTSGPRKGQEQVLAKLLDNKEVLEVTY